MREYIKRFIGVYDIRSKNNVLVNRLWGVLGIDMLVKASGFLLIPFYLMLMTQGEFGLYNYIISIIQTFSLILNLGLYISVTKYYHSHSSSTERGKFLFTIFITLSVFIVAVIVPLYLLGLDYRIIKFLFSTTFAYQDYRGLILLGLLVSTMSFTLNSYLFTSEKIRQIKTYNICRILLINILSVIGLYLIDSDSVQIRLTFTYVGELLLLTFFGYFAMKEMVPEFKNKLMRSSLKMGIPVMLSSILGIVVNFGDKFFLEKYGTIEDLSNYYLAFSFASIIPLIFASFQNVWLPIFMKEKDVQKNYEKTKRIISKLILLFMVLAVIIWIGFQALLWLHFIPIKYSQVTYILPILLMTQIVASIVPLFSNYFIYFEKTQIVTIAGIFVGICSLTLALFLIPVLNVYGAALTALISNMLYLFVYYYMVVLIKTKHLASVTTL